MATAMTLGRFTQDFTFSLPILFHRLIPFWPEVALLAKTCFKTDQYTGVWKTLGSRSPWSLILAASPEDWQLGALCDLSTVRTILLPETGVFETKLMQIHELFPDYSELTLPSPHGTQTSFPPGRSP